MIYKAKHLVFLSEKLKSRNRLVIVWSAQNTITIR